MNWWSSDMGKSLRQIDVFVVPIPPRRFGQKICMEPTWRTVCTQFSPFYVPLRATHVYIKVIWSFLVGKSAIVIPSAHKRERSFIGSGSPQAEMRIPQCQVLSPTTAWFITLSKALVSGKENHILNHNDKWTPGFADHVHKILAANENWTWSLMVVCFDSTRLKPISPESLWWPF